MIKQITFSILLLFFIATQQILAAEVRVTNLDDLDAGTWSGSSGSINVEDDICIYSDTGSYIITATGSGAADRFRLANGSPFINYTVRWNDESGTTSGQVQLTKGTTSATQTTSETVSSDCSGGSNLTAHLQIRFAFGQLQQRLSGNYSGTLTLEIGVI